MKLLLLFFTRRSTILTENGSESPSFIGFVTIGYCYDRAKRQRRRDCTYPVNEVPVLEASQFCQPDGSGVRRYNGKPCASTTRYADGMKGACGCGGDGETPFQWNLQGYTTAPSEKYFDDGGSNLWCGKNCGKCVKLTPTGGFVDGKGGSPPNNSPVTFLMTNACPINGNQEWCGINGKPGTNQVNTYGYEVHFDLQNQGRQVDALGWDNPEVTWEEVSCPGDLQSNWQQCYCSHPLA